MSVRREQTITKIRSLIREGQLDSGDKLPPERSLSETFRVSRNCVREALRVLAEQGVVESRQGDGTYVREPYVTTGGRESLVEAMADAFSDQRGRMREIFEFRRMIEPELAALAAERASDQQISVLKIVACDQQRRILAGRSDSDLDAEFHRQLGLAAGNSVAVEALTALRNIIAQTRSPALQSEERRRGAVNAHLTIIDALEARDAEQARAAMRAHLDMVEHQALDLGKGSRKS